MENQHYGKYFPETLRAYHETKEGLKTQLLTHGLLQYLDLFKPFLTIPLKTLQDFENDLMKKIPLNVTLEFWSVPTASCRLYFPESFISGELLQTLLEKLAFTISETLYIHVCILDVITCLCLLLNGAWKDKMTMIFKWYNLNQTGLMEEEEHFLCLRRIGHCLRKLKFIGAMELTDDDAKFLAVEARIMVDTKRNQNKEKQQLASFRPGLYIDDFISWSESNHVCKLVFEFIRVFQRLLDMLALLDMRCDKLHSISEAKQNEQKKSFPVPIELPNIIKKKMINYNTTNKNITLVYCDANRVSFFVKNERLPHHRGLQERIYARVDREIDFPDVFQQSISPNIISRNKLRNDAIYTQGLRCFRKYYTVSSVRLATTAPTPTTTRPGNPTTIAKRLDVPMLDPSSQYCITLFNERGETFRSIRIKTPSNVWLDATTCPSFSILPSTMTSTQFLDLRTNAIFGNKHHIMFTGTIGNYKQTFSEITDMVTTLGIQCGLEGFRKFLTNALIMFRQTVAGHLCKDVFALTNAFYACNQDSQRSYSSSLKSDPIQNISGKNCFYFYHGSMPWNNLEENFYALKDHLGFEFFSILRKMLQDLYEEEVVALSTPVFRFPIGKNCSLYMLDDKDSSAAEQGSAIDVQTLTNHLVDQLRNIHILSSTISNSSKIEMLLLMKSPSQLFGKKLFDHGSDPLLKYFSRDIFQEREQINPIVELGPTFDTTFAEQQKSDYVHEMKQDERMKPLRGRHELIHGEYSARPIASQQQQNFIPATPSSRPENLDDQKPLDETFIAFLKAAFSYVAAIKFQKGLMEQHELTPIVLVSTNWHGGKNFRLKRRVDDVQLTIEHINLLSTQTIQTGSWGNQIESDNELLLNRLRSSLPNDVELEFCPDTPDRLITIQGRLNGVSFEEIPHPNLPLSNSFSHHPINIFRNDSPATLLKPPRCHQLSTDSALIGVEADGIGMVKAVMYELPIAMRYDQFRELMFTEAGRSKLRLVFPPQKDSTDFRNIRYLRGKPRYCLFRFEKLRPHTCYGVYLDTTQAKVALEENKFYINPLQTFMFKTQSDNSQSNISTFLFTAFATDEAGYSSLPDPSGLGNFRLRKLAELHDVYRFSNSHVTGIFCQHDEAGSSISSAVSNPSFSRLQRFNLLELQPPPLKDIYLSGATGDFGCSHKEFEPKSAYFRSPMAEKVVQLFPQLGSVHLSFHGTYGYIMPTLPTNESLREIIKALKLSIWKQKNVKVLVVFTGKTLIHSLFRDKKGQCSSERVTYENKLLVAEFIDALLKWKFEDQEVNLNFNSTTSSNATSGREVKLIGAGHVRKVTTIVISRILREPVVVFESSDGISIAQTQLSTTQMSQVSGSAEVLSLDSSLSRSLAEKSKVIPLNPLQLSHLSSIFTKTGIHYTIFPVYYDTSAIKEKFGGTGSIQKSQNDDDQSIGSMDSAKNLKQNSTDENFNNSLMLPEGVNYLDDNIIYEVLPHSVSKFNGMSFTKARTELYTDAVLKFTEKEPVFYRIDMLMDDIFSIPLPDPEVDYEASVASNSEFVHSSSLIGSTGHGVWMNVQEIVSRFDFFRIVVGPLIGKVTTTDVRIIFEFNMDIPEVICVLRRSTGVDPEQRTLEYLSLENGMTAPDEDEDTESNDGSKVICKVFHILAFIPVVFHFKNLQSDSKYEIMIPRLFPLKMLGSFRTTPKYIANTDILFVGGNHFANVPILTNILDESAKSQTINLQNIRILNDFVYNLPSEELLDYERMPSVWNLLRDKLNSPGSSVSIVLHLAPQTILSILWKNFLPVYLDIASRIPLIAVEKTTVMAMYMQQLEHCIKDSITCILSSPAIAQVFAMSSNIVLYHSDYLLPSNTTTGHDADEDSAEYRYTILIRKLFQQQIREYIVNMYGIDNPDAKDFFHTWRIGSVVMAMIDNTSGRGKLKKEDISVMPSTMSSKVATRAIAPIPEDVGDDDDGIEEIIQSERKEENISMDNNSRSYATKGESLNPSHVFSLGFMDRNQWKSLRSLALDKTLTQLVLIFENPIISLYGISEEYRSPESLGKGEVLPWGPTMNDLKIFLQFWIDWILNFRKESKGLEIRSVLFVSQSDVPYTTVIQDIRTGLKIHQVCVGSYSLRDDFSTSNSKRPLSSTIRKKEIRFHGKIGTMRYSHRLTNQDYFRIEPFSKEAVRAMMALSSENEINPSSTRSVQISDEMLDNAYYCGFAKLKIFLDNWNPVNLWANETLAEGDKPMVSLTRPKIDTSTDAILTLGPIIGVPYRIAKEHEEVVKPQDEKSIRGQDEENEANESKKVLVNVPVMLEVDRITSMTILVTGVVNGEKLEIHAQNVKANLPIILEIGPLEKDERYLVQILTGIKPSPYNDFVISTHLHWDETNIVILNAELNKEMNPSTILITDLTQRCFVPYNGINAVVHTNFQPNFESMIQEHQYNQVLVDGLSNYRKRGRPSPRLKREVGEILSAFREKFRDVLSRPSYRELMKSPTSHIFLPQVTIPMYSPKDVTSEVLIDGEGRLQRATRLLQLIENRVIQEYVDQLRYPGCNVFRSVTTSEVKQIHYPDYQELEIPGNNETMTKSQLERLWIHFVRVTCDLFQEPISQLPAGNTAPANGNQEGTHHNIYWCVPNEDAVESILSQWLLGCNSAPVVWLPWISLNSKVSLEVLPVLNKYQLHITSRLLGMFTEFLTTRKIVSIRNSNPSNSTDGGKIPNLSSQSFDSMNSSKTLLQDNSNNPKNETNKVEQLTLTDAEYSATRSFAATRIIFISGKVQTNESAEEFLNSSSEITLTMVRHMNDWKSLYSHRDYTFICPSNKHGTQAYELKAKYFLPPLNPKAKNAQPIEMGIDFVMQVVDTIYRSNEFDRRFHMAERERHFQLTRKKIGAAAGKSKRAQQRREEEERIQRATILKEVQDVMSKQIPDGYLMINAFTTTILSTLPTDPLKDNAKPSNETQGSVTVLDDKSPSNEPNETDAGDGVIEEKTENENNETEQVPPNDDLPNDDAVQASKKEEENGEMAKVLDESSPPANPIDPYAHVDIITTFNVTVQGDKVASEMQNTGSIAAFENGNDPEAEAARTADRYLTLQLPLWMVKLLLPSETVFVQDEILLVMRQSTKTKRILDRIESGEFNQMLIKFYENSRLSELSRPPDLREVDLTIDGIIPIFFRDVINRIWENGLPDEVKGRMLNLTDPFVRAYCFSRAMPNMEVLSSAVTFAQAVNHACIMSIAMKTARRMSKNPKYKYLMDIPDPAAVAVAAIEKEEAALEEKKLQIEIEKAEILGVERLLENIKTLGQKKTKNATKNESHDPEVEKELEEKDRLIQKLQEDAANLNPETVNYDSDIEELDKEQAIVEKLQEELEELEERKLEEAEKKEELERERMEEAKEKLKAMDAALDAEIQMSKEEQAKLGKERTELAHRAAEDALALISDEVIFEAACNLAPILRIENTVYEAPPKTRESQRAASIKHMYRLKQERERMRILIGPRLIHMS